jgi:dTDP-4-amino-4,6-dideoxygalactose transaminase
VRRCGRIAGGAWYEHHSIGGNYRLSEFQGAVLNAQFSRLADQLETREQNGDYLDKRLSKLAGVIPQRRTADCTRHGYHLFAIRLDTAELGVARDVFLHALAAEGIPAFAGYGIPLYRQPLFRNLAFGPYTSYRSSRPNLNYGLVRCPNCEVICLDQGIWLEQRTLLGTREDMEDVVLAFQKVVEMRASLTSGNVAPQ